MIEINDILCEIKFSWLNGKLVEIKKNFLMKNDSSLYLNDPIFIN